MAIKQQQCFSISLFLTLFLFTATKTLSQPAAAPSVPTTASPPAPSLPTLVPPAPSQPALAPPAVIPSPPADAPAPPGPTNITKILEKATGFALFIRLLKSTAAYNQIEEYLNDTNNGMTIFAPSDGAFSSLSTGTLNALNDQQKAALTQFHTIPSYIPIAQFQTVSNPLRTTAGDNSRYKYPLNVTSYSTSSVNISTGITNASVTATVYKDGLLAIYTVDHVLLPYDLFGVKPPAPAPSPYKPKKSKPDASVDQDDGSSSDGDGTIVSTSAGSRVGAMVETVVMFNSVVFGVASALFWL